MEGSFVFPGIFLCLVGSADASAQSGRGVHFGVMGAGVFSKIGGEAVQGEEISTRVGFALGGFATIGMGRNLAIEPGILFTQKGAKSVDGTTSSKLQLSYVEVPVLVKLRFPGASGGMVVPHVYAGPYLGFKAGCRLSSTNGSVSVSAGCEDQPFDVRIKSTDFGATLGAGVDVGRAIIDVRYDLGLSKIGGDPVDSDLKNRSFYLLVGWTFRSPN